MLNVNTMTNCQVGNLLKPLERDPVEKTLHRTAWRITGLIAGLFLISRENIQEKFWLAASVPVLFDAIIDSIKLSKIESERLSRWALKSECVDMLNTIEPYKKYIKLTKDDQQKFDIGLKVLQNAQPLLSVQEQASIDCEKYTRTAMKIKSVFCMSAFIQMVPSHIKEIAWSGLWDKIHMGSTWMEYRDHFGIYWKVAKACQALEQFSEFSMRASGTYGVYHWMANG
ncbi:MAG TPA: hypothetical protein VLE95_02210 [Chlamydiales bacterium]|nr:hypothetical protein [Chlamydiales bacterium]